MLHELRVEEVNADGALELVDIKLFKQQIVGLLLGDLRFLTRNRQGFNSLNDETAGEVRANQANHLVVVEGSHNLVVGSLVENLFDLLQETLPVEES